MDKYTKGPWQITHEGYDHNGNYKHQIGTNEVTVAYTWCPCDHSPPPAAMVANANLIKTAPNLLKSCQAMMAYFESNFIVRNTDNDHNSDWALNSLSFVKDMVDLHKAIARATGNNNEGETK